MLLPNNLFYQWGLERLSNLQKSYRFGVKITTWASMAQRLLTHICSTSGTQIFYNFISSWHYLRRKVGQSRNHKVIGYTALLLYVQMILADKVKVKENMRSPAAKLTWQPVSQGDATLRSTQRLITQMQSKIWWIEAVNPVSITYRECLVVADEETCHQLSMAVHFYKIVRRDY